MPSDTPSITAGDVFFDKPPTVIFTLRRDRVVYVGPVPVRSDQHAAHLAAMRARHPNEGVELRAFKSATLADISPVLQAMSRAGYSRFWVFGHRNAVLELAAGLRAIQRLDLTLLIRDCSVT